MALGFKETLQQQLNDLVSNVQQEEARLKAAWQELNSKRSQFEEECAAFEAEKQMIAAVSNMVRSKVKLDVGGTTYHASRTTLTSIPGSMLEAMFSGRHALEEDEDGRAFIDRDGATFKLVLEYLRSPALFSLDGLSEREVASCKAEFDFYGLPLPVPPAPALCLHTNTGPSGCVSALLQGNTCIISASECWHGDWAIGAEALADDAVWKLRIQQCSRDVAMGVITNPAPHRCACRDATFAGWCYPNKICAHGSDQRSLGWPGWQNNDEAIFKLNTPARRLTVHLKRTGQCYTFSNLPAGKHVQWRFCVDMAGERVVVVLSCPTDDERMLVQ